MTRRVLITGGAGFIGSHLADYFLSKSFQVAILDNESTGLRQNVPAGAEYSVGDVRNPADLAPIFERGVDIVLHIAGQASIFRSFDTPLEDLNTNVAGTLNVLQACVAYGTPRLIFAGSMTVYGNPRTQPVPESEIPAPISYYGITKYAAERYVLATALRNDLPKAVNVTAFRMFNVYGERQRLDNPYQGVLGYFLGNVLRGEAVHIYGDGQQTRDFIYIQDVVRAWAAALDNPATYGQVFNLGFGEGTSINALVDAVLEAAGRTRRDYPVIYGAERTGDIRFVAADTSRFQAATGWQPSVPLNEGIRRTLAWAAGGQEVSKPTPGD